MNKLMLILASFLVSLFEVALLPLPIAATFVVLLSLYGTAKFSLLVTFLTGVFLDIFSVGTVGTASVIFLTTAFIITLYKRRFRQKNVFFVFFVLILGILFSSVIRGDFSFTTTTLNNTLITSLIVTILWVIVSILSRQKGYEVWTKFS